jgi:hypothetical protein
MYALAATTAGVGTLALVQPAEAKIIYTPAHVKIVRASIVSLDLNHDGVVISAFMTIRSRAEHGLGPI